MTKYASSAARKMAQQHANEMELCGKYMEACKQAGDKQGAGTQQVSRQARLCEHKQTLGIVR